MDTWVVDAAAVLSDGQALKRRFDEQGYVFIEGAVDGELVRRLALQVFESALTLDVDLSLDACDLALLSEEKRQRACYAASALEAVNQMPSRTDNSRHCGISYW